MNKKNKAQRKIESRQNSRNNLRSKLYSSMGSKGILGDREIKKYFEARNYVLSHSSEINLGEFPSSNPSREQYDRVRNIAYSLGYKYN